MAFLDNELIGNRLKEVRGKINKRQYAMGASIDPSQYNKIEAGELSITEKIMEKLTQAYGINKDYLLFGKGVPKEGYLATRQHQKLVKPQRKNAVPFYDTEATASDVGSEMTPISAPAGTIDIGDLLHDSQAAIRIYGNSMLPNYPPGCVVGLVETNEAFIQPGEVYVIETTDQRLLKRLFYKEDDPDSETFTCYSDNVMKFEGGARSGKAAYPPFNLSRKDIKKLFIVTGVIKRNTNSIIMNRNN